MGKSAAKQGDKITTRDMHKIQPPGPVAPIDTPFPFTGVITGQLSSNVRINGLPAAIVDSTVKNSMPHVQFLLQNLPKGSTFVNPPKDQGKIVTGSGTVFINGKAAARTGDIVETCADPIPNQAGKLIAVCTVMIGD